MSLLAILGTARDALATTSLRSQAHAQNIYNANVAGYSRLSTHGLTVLGSASQMVITRAADDALLREASDAQTALSGATTRQSLLKQLEPGSSDPADESSLSALFGKFQAALTEFAGSPSDPVLAGSVFGAAKQVVNELKASASRIESVRQTISDGLESQAAALREALSAYGDADRKLARSKEGSLDYARAEDARDLALARIAPLIDVQQSVRTPGESILTTKSGIVLYDKEPRAVAATNNGGAPSLSIDGVNVTGPESPMPLTGGSMLALSRFDQDTLKSYQVQLDEVARNLIETFSETGPAPPANKPPVQGLFVSNTPLVLGSGVYVQGLASTISVNTNAGNTVAGAQMFRDGQLGAPLDSSYSTNSAGASDFSAHIRDVIGKAQSTASFDPAGSLDTQSSLQEYLVAGRGWINEKLSITNTEVENASARASLLADLRQSSVGVDTDTEMQIVLEIEHSYQATAKLIASVDQMLQSLMQMVN